MQHSYNIERTFINLCADENDTESFTINSFQRTRSKSWDGTLLCKSACIDCDTQGCCRDDQSVGSTPTTARSIEESSDGTVESGSMEFEFEEALSFREDMEIALPVSMQIESAPTCLPCMCVAQPCAHSGQWVNTGMQFSSHSNVHAGSVKYMVQSPVWHSTSEFQPNILPMMPSVLENLADAVAMAKQLKHEAAKLRFEARKQAGNHASDIRTPTAEKFPKHLKPCVADVGAAFGSLIDGCHTELKENQRTTLMFRNIPGNYSRDQLLEHLDSEGFSGMYDFVYLPIDFQRWAGLGYAFVNAVTNVDAQRIRAHFQGFKKWSTGSLKVCEVCWGEPLQGLEAHIERYRDSPVMHEVVPDRFRPVIFEQGQRVGFPTPTKRIRPPRTKKYPSRGVQRLTSFHTNESV